MPIVLQRTYILTLIGATRRPNVGLGSIEQYQTIVETALRAAGFEEPPVSVRALAAHLGVPVHEVPLPPWFDAVTGVSM